ncbi:receptor-like protein EIX1 [Prosopis cineraria]|uniref:receptor-like protein EIX1 n=1 Tax=Prosopis cineraria TaxID=364024 RepID=UPI00241003BF|nr:receptor-like protein EIX1 [Prosopis cineraria]XP_054814923.1 receptor-like protein EIX1 [Prosopis cineraria]
MEKLPTIELLLHFLCLLILVSVGSSNGHMINRLASEREALVDFKTGLHDPENVLSSWRGSNCCQWLGIQRDNNTGAVVAVDIHGMGGEIRPSLMQLKSLGHLNLSFNSFNGTATPQFLGSLDNLQYLNLSYAGFGGLIPSSLGNLSHLEVLDLKVRHDLSIDNFQWITGLISLEYLDMSGVNLSLVKDWVDALNQLPSIFELHLSGCSLFGYDPSLVSLNFTSLAVMDLSFNNFNSKIPDWVQNVSSLQYLDMSESKLYGRIPLGLGEMPNLVSLDLSLNYNLTASCSKLFRKRWEKIEVINFRENKVLGKLPSSLGNMTSLSRLYLDSNAIEGGIPSSIGKLCNLNRFSLSRNNVTGNLPEILEGIETCPFTNPLHNLQYLVLSHNQLGGKIPHWLGQLEHMVGLDLSYNLFEGAIPTLGSLQNLNILQLRKNKLSGTLPESLGQLSALSGFDVSSNQLTGIVSEIHFSKLTHLTFLDLSFNSFIVNISSNWMPPFQVEVLIVSSCILGPSFPAWLQSQKEIKLLDLSNASIADSMPNWSWIGTPHFTFLSLSQNQFFGQIPESIGEKCDSLLTIDLSRNNFMGRIPSSLANCSNLNALDLSHNNLFGAIPNSLGQLQWLRLLHLSDNHLSGRLPSSFINLSYLQTLDLGNKELSDGIPSWIGDGFSYLEILNLRSNAFFGEIPHGLSKLSSLQVLDLGRKT